LDPNHKVVDAIAVDHTINVTHRSASSGHQAVSDDCKRVLHTKATQGLQLTTIASYLAVGTPGVREVLLLHGDPGDGDDARMIEGAQGDTGGFAAYDSDGEDGEDENQGEWAPSAASVLKLYLY
jgi:hypothetical protein